MAKEAALKAIAIDTLAGPSRTGDGDRIRLGLGNAEGNSAGDRA